MPACQIVIRTEDSPGGPTTALVDAWVYWREGGAVTVLRTDHEGRLTQVEPNGDATRPWQYAPPFSTTTGTQVDLFHSHGARPIPAERLSDPPDVFVPRTVSLPPSGALAPQLAPVAPNSPNTLVVTPTAVIVITAMPITLTRPTELSLWPMLWSPVSDVFATNGLHQGAALWGPTGLTVTENAAAPAPADANRPKPRGLRVTGTIAAGATGVTIRLVDARGRLVALRQTVTSTTTVEEITGTVLEPNGAARPFEATVHLGAMPEAFGPLLVVVRSQGLTPPLMAGFACQLVGVQITLVADPSDGRTRGPVRTEADDVVIVDFRTSPQTTREALSAQTRARRMLPFDISTRQRPLAEGSATNVDTPEMPLWMAELHLIGLDRAALEDLLVRRPHLPVPQEASLRLALSWSLGLSWDGPDSGTTSDRRYQYRTSFTGTQDVELSLDDQGRIAGTNERGEVPEAITPVPEQITFPVADRRTPMVVVEGQTRRWGRRTDIIESSTLLVEWQPRIVANNREIIRGGDGKLSLTTLEIDGSRADIGVADPPVTAATPDATLPDFRVRGVDPQLPANALIDALVGEYVNTHANENSVSLLTLDCWRTTVRLILAHEGGHQFEYRGAGRYRYAGQYYGREEDMPIFGPPHGYGYGQHDNPRVSDDGAWSFVENIRESVRRIIQDKGGAAYTHISGHLPQTLNQRIRAVYQRELVRRYNGGSEFRWNSTAQTWEIRPSVAQWANDADHTQGANPRLLYPNQVLGTTITYSNGTGVATTFPWPIAFTDESYGPDTGT